jgi:CsoR family transcriptional regulator, copper-sensing transcriptional repressor
VTAPMDTQEDILVRLRRIEGQIRGLQRMISERRQCEEVITQIMAARAALDRVALLALQRYLDECMPTCAEFERERLKKVMGMSLRLPTSYPCLDSDDAPEARNSLGHQPKEAPQAS